ncbi:MAG: UDP-forming cellulose synthase catalytic subunit [Plesiomonas sp.]|uniref:UDP-forming cellulose synthase catalytic subunit n=1 Tax=Plesiomonas sp. TaxID=2486279 RepID=UPI003F3B7C2C
MFGSVLGWIFAPEFTASIQARYQRYHRHWRSPIALCGVVLWLLIWSVFRLESPACQWLSQNKQTLYPLLRQPKRQFADPLRLLIQTIWLLLRGAYNHKTNIAQKISKLSAALFGHLSTLKQRLYHKINTFQYYNSPLLRSLSEKGPWYQTNNWLTAALRWGYLVIALLLAVLCITEPFGLLAQLTFVIILWVMALLIRNIPGRFSSMMMIVLSVVISCRYLWWRYTATLNWDNGVDLFFGLGLLAAETYSWLVLMLGYFQAIWPLHRSPYPLPANMDNWPSVDIYIPTYNEDLSVIRPTVYAALGLDWPQEKLNIYILDDGKRSYLADFAAEVGVHYLIRDNNFHAKAGNLNAAMKITNGEFIAVFDCDHIPTRSFLQMTLGWFVKDDKLGVMQTPHHFFSPDPFERNLGNFRKTPNENTLFYGLVQDGNDTWDATFFCGSCAVIRRSALEEIGGFAVETVTEDAHTSLRLHRHGYRSAYIRIPQAAGLATESLSAHVGQRIRWARGMVQIFRLDNPLFGKGLSWAQRICYSNAMLHFLSGVPRLVYLTAPLAFLIFHAYIIYAPAVMILLYVVPHMVHASLTNSRIQGKYRYSFWSEIYETVLSWYIARPTTVALINPRKGKFNVTAKGGLIDDQYFDWDISRPFLVLAMLNLIGVGFAGYRFIWGPGDEMITVFVSLLWTFYNLLLLGGAVAVASEVKQVRRTHRVQITLPAVVYRNNGHAYPCTMVDYSDGGVGIEMPQVQKFDAGETVQLMLKRGTQEFLFKSRVCNQRNTFLGIQLEHMDLQSHIHFVQCTFARADTWAMWQESYQVDQPMRSIRDIFAVGLRGYKQMAKQAPASVRWLINALVWITEWIGTFMPHTPTMSPVADPVNSKQEAKS